jgi:hypothetical protein
MWTRRSITSFLERTTNLPISVLYNLGLRRQSAPSGAVCQVNINQLCILPTWRHLGYGKKPLDFCKTKTASIGGHTIKLDIIEEKTILKDWYAAYMMSKGSHSRSVSCPSLGVDGVDGSGAGAEGVCGVWGGAGVWVDMVGASWVGSTEEGVSWEGASFEGVDVWF